MVTKPLVSVVIVNYNGVNFLKNCLTSLRGLDFSQKKFEVLLVDNNSSDGSIRFVEKNFPNVRIVKSEINLGFAGGCNLGVKNSTGQYVVLLNTDTKVDKLWLKTLIRRIRSDRKIAAVNSKVLLYYPFFELSILSGINPMEGFSKSLNFIAVGVLIENVILDNQELQLLLRYRSGFYEREEPGYWTRGDARLLIPYDPFKEEVRVTLIVRSEKFANDTDLTIKIGERSLLEETMIPYETKRIHLIIKTSELKNNHLFAVQNAGVAVFKNGYGRDRGAVVRKNHQFYEIDNPYYDKPQELHSFSGASVAIRKDLYEKLGGFDEKFFMYYEDVDLSLRLRRLGWKIYYEPTSVVYHIHSGSSQEWSTFFNYHVEKNHLALLIKHFSLIQFFKQLIAYGAKILVSVSHMYHQRIQNDWSEYYGWREKVQYRKKVFKWVLRNFLAFYISRLKINSSEKVSRSKLNSSHY